MHESRSLSDFKSSALTLEITGNFLSHTDTHAYELRSKLSQKSDLGDTHTHTHNNCVYLLALWLKCAKKYLPKYM